MRTQNWATDNQTGRTYAVNLIADTSNPLIVVAVLRAMIRKGVYEGVEAGFIQVVVERLSPPAPVDHGD